MFRVFVKQISIWQFHRKLKNFWSKTIPEAKEEIEEYGF